MEVVGVSRKLDLSPSFSLPFGHIYETGFSSRLFCSLGPVQLPTPFLQGDFLVTGIFPSALQNFYKTTPIGNFSQSFGVSGSACSFLCAWISTGS